MKAAEEKPPYIMHAGKWNVVIVDCYVKTKRVSEDETWWIQNVVFRLEDGSLRRFVERIPPNYKLAVFPGDRFTLETIERKVKSGGLYIEHRWAAA